MERNKLGNRRRKIPECQKEIDSDDFYVLKKNQRSRKTTNIDEVSDDIHSSGDEIQQQQKIKKSSTKTGNNNYEINEQSSTRKNKKKKNTTKRALISDEKYLQRQRSNYEDNQDYYDDYEDDYEDEKRVEKMKPKKKIIKKYALVQDEKQQSKKNFNYDENQDDFDSYSDEQIEKKPPTKKNTKNHGLAQGNNKRFKNTSHYDKNQDYYDDYGYDYDGQVEKKPQKKVKIIKKYALVQDEEQPSKKNFNYKKNQDDFNDHNNKQIGKTKTKKVVKKYALVQSNQVPNSDDELDQGFEANNHRSGTKVKKNKIKKLLVSSSDDDTGFDQETEAKHKSKASTSNPKNKKNVSNNIPAKKNNKYLVSSSDDDDNGELDPQIESTNKSKAPKPTHQKNVSESTRTTRNKNYLVSSSDEDDGEFDQETKDINKLKTPRPKQGKKIVKMYALVNDDETPEDNTDIPKTDEKSKETPESDKTKEQQSSNKKYTQYEITEITNQNYYLAEELNKLQKEKEQIYFKQILKASEKRNSKMRDSIEETKNIIEAIDGRDREGEFLDEITKDDKNLSLIMQKLHDFEVKRSDYWVRLRKYKESIKRKKDFDFSPIDDREELDNVRNKVINLISDDLNILGKSLDNIQTDIINASREFDFELNLRNLNTLQEYNDSLDTTLETNQDEINDAQTIYTRSRTFSSNIKIPIEDYYVDNLDPYAASLNQIKIDNQELKSKEEIIQNDKEIRKKVYRSTDKKWKEVTSQKRKINDINEDEDIKKLNDECNHLLELIQEGADEQNKLSIKYDKLSRLRNEFGCKNKLELNLLLADENSQQLIPEMVEKVDFLNNAYEGIKNLDIVLHGHKPGEIDAATRYNSVIDELEKMKYNYDPSLLDDNTLSPDLKEKAKKAHDEFRNLLNLKYNDETTKQRYELLSEDDDLEDLGDIDI